MRAHNRKATPRVIAGRVQKKNNWDLSADYYRAAVPGSPVIDRKRPGPGYRHVLTKKDVCDFIGILPDWEELSVGLHAIVLAPGEAGAYGYHVPGVVHVCAWEADPWQISDTAFYDEHKDVLARLGVECEPVAAYLNRQSACGVPLAELRSLFP